MKKKGLVKLFISFFMMSNLVFAVENANLLKTDETQKKYERKVVIGMDIGLPTRNLKIPVVYCYKTKKKIICPEKAKITYFVNQNLENKLAKNIYDWIITQRFDKIIINPNKVYIITARSEKVIDKNLNKTFDFDYGSYNDFKKKLKEYLDNTLAPIVSKLLSLSLEERYKELPDKEKETFIKTKAKELGIPYEVAKKLMNSAYVFGVYFDPTDIFIKVTQKKIKIGKNLLVIYDTSLKNYGKVKLIIYKFNPDTQKFKFYRELSGNSGLITESQKFKFKPKNLDFYPLVEQALIKTVKAVGINLNYKIKKDNNFAIFTTIDYIKNKKIKAPIGVLEDLRVDAPYIVQEKINGKMKNVGFIKVRKVANNCKKTKYSEFDLIKGNAELKDRLREHPWTGLFGKVSLGMDNFEIEKLNDIELNKGGGNFFTISFGFKGDLGYILNLKNLSEVWFDLVPIKFGFGGDELEDVAGVKITDKPLYYAFNLDVEKRFYIQNGFYFEVGGGLGLNTVWASYDATYNNTSSDTFYAGSIFIETKISLGYNFNIDTEAYFKTGYKFPLYTFTNENSVDIKSGITIEAGLNIHIPFVGNFANLYSKPSNVCKVK